ncbi:hypothetical protein ACFL03_12525 [Thermodesulfobacteriota bacterium]
MKRKEKWAILAVGLNRLKKSKYIVIHTAQKAWMIFQIVTPRAATANVMINIS